ncbi:response regulator [Paraburkholderia acidicola]|uniref:Response regulator n=1 Tax=Paraburkholderia acidicola TaxID=1912599 RepID=A0ABV1LPE7_9BURK
MATRILVVDRDAELCKSLGDFLERHDIEISTLPSAGLLERCLEHSTPDLVLLDHMQPGGDGLTALGNLRASGNEIPVIMLAASADDVDRIIGLEMGADDYIGKPLNLRELLARIRAVLRRASAARPVSALHESWRVAFGPFTLDIRSRMVHHDEQPIMLSDREFELLRIFVNQPMRLFKREQLAALLFGPNDERMARGLDVLVWRLRQMIEVRPSTPKLIQTVRGHGYIFVPGGEQFAPRPREVVAGVIAGVVEEQRAT